MMEPAFAYRSTKQDSSVSAYGHRSVQQRDEGRERSNVGEHHLARISSVGRLDGLVLIILLIGCSLRVVYGRLGGSMSRGNNMQT